MLAYTYTVAGCFFTPAEFAAFIEADVKRNAEILRVARYQPE